MNEATRKRALKLFEKIERKHDTAMKSLLRYTWRPGTTTGNRDHDRSVKAEAEMFEALADLRELLGIRLEEGV